MIPDACPTCGVHVIELAQEPWPPTHEGVFELVNPETRLVYRPCGCSAVIA